jgi:hypothetical protein
MPLASEWRPNDGALNTRPSKSTSSFVPFEAGRSVCLHPLQSNPETPTLCRLKRIDTPQETHVRNRRRKGHTYPENWRRCRKCGAIVALGTDHDCQSATPTADGEQPGPDQDSDEG